MQKVITSTQLPVHAKLSMDASLTNQPPSRLWSSLTLQDSFKHQFYLLIARVFLALRGHLQCYQVHFRDQHIGLFVWLRLKYESSIRQPTSTRIGVDISKY